MSLPITSWLRALFAVHERAMESRGFQQIITDEDEVVRWPRTLGIDVVAIASVLDQTVRAQAARNDDHGIARRWQTTMEELERHALVDPLTEYTQNQEFWQTLPTICVYLHSHSAPLLQPEVLDTLFVQLGDQYVRNNGPQTNGLFMHFDGVKTFDDLYIKELLYLKGLRGFDKMMTDDGKPPERIIPRSTNADVIALAEYWSKELATVRDAVEQQPAGALWKATVADVERLARKGDPFAVYAKNNAFWRALRTTAIYISAAEFESFLASIVRRFSERTSSHV